MEIRSHYDQPRARKAAWVPRPQRKHRAQFVAAIEKTGRKNLIMAGVTVDVCLAFAAMQAADAGYNVYGVVDVSGALDVTIRENAVARMRDHGITPVNLALKKPPLLVPRCLIVSKEATGPNTIVFGSAVFGRCTFDALYRDTAVAGSVKRNDLAIFGQTSKRCR